MSLVRRAIANSTADNADTRPLSLAEEFEFLELIQSFQPSSDPPTVNSEVELQESADEMTQSFQPPSDPPTVNTKVELQESADEMIQSFQPPSDPATVNTEVELQKSADEMTQSFQPSSDPPTVNSEVELQESADKMIQSFQPSSELPTVNTIVEWQESSDEMSLHVVILTWDSPEHPTAWGYAQIDASAPFDPAWNLERDILALREPFHNGTEPIPVLPPIYYAPWEFWMLEVPCQLEALQQKYPLLDEIVYYGRLIDMSERMLPCPVDDCGALVLATPRDASDHLHYFHPDKKDENGKIISCYSSRYTTLQHAFTIIRCGWCGVAASIADAHYLECPKIRELARTVEENGDMSEDLYALLNPQMVVPLVEEEGTQEQEGASGLSAHR